MREPLPGASIFEITKGARMSAQVAESKELRLVDLVLGLSFADRDFAQLIKGLDVLASELRDDPTTPEALKAIARHQAMGDALAEKRPETIGKLQEATTITPSPACCAVMERCADELKDWNLRKMPVPTEKNLLTAFVSFEREAKDGPLTRLGILGRVEEYAANLV